MGHARLPRLAIGYREHQSISCSPRMAPRVHLYLLGRGHAWIAHLIAWVCCRQPDTHCQMVCVLVVGSPVLRSLAPRTFVGLQGESEKAPSCRAQPASRQDLSLTSSPVGRNAGSGRHWHGTRQVCPVRHCSDTTVRLAGCTAGRNSSVEHGTATGMSGSCRENCAK